MVIGALDAGSFGWGALFGIAVLVAAIRVAEEVGRRKREREQARSQENWMQWRRDVIKRFHGADGTMAKGALAEEPHRKEPREEVR